MLQTVTNSTDTDDMMIDDLGPGIDGSTNVTLAGMKLMLQ